MRPDPHVLQKRLPSTIANYRRCIKEFMLWCVRCSVWPHCVDELDDLLVEYKNQCLDMARSKFTNTVVGAELAVPGAKGKLVWSRSVLSAWESVAAIRHHKPLPKLLATLYALLLSWIGRPRLGAGLFVQTERGLRPSEMLGLTRDAVVTPKAAIGGQVIVLNLGVRAGTKLKRPQAVLVNAKLQPRSFCLLHQLASTTPDQQLLFGTVSLVQYQTMFKWLNACMGWSEYSPHSPRAGFASDAVLEGKSFVDIREEGRWTADSSLRIYLDLVATAFTAAETDMQHLTEHLLDLNENFLQYFVWWPGCTLQQTLPIPVFWKDKLLKAMEKWPAPARTQTLQRTAGGGDGL